MRLASALVLSVVLTALTCGVLLAGDEYAPVIEPAAFTGPDGQPLPIDNPYMPLEPGTLYLYEGEGRTGPLFEIVFVSYDTKEILGVTCTVVEHLEWTWKAETSEWRLKEVTYNWHAQDLGGNVWYFGEDTTEYDDADDFDTSEGGSWEAGDDGAQPGISMPGNPIVGLAYRKEYYPTVAEDMAKVIHLDAKASSEYGDYQGCLKTKEWTPIEPGAVENKYYAEGVGLVLGKGPKGGKEHLELVDMVTGVLAN